jgi:hypothetical protein
MAVETEFSLRLPNSPGALADLCSVLAGEHINIVALSLESAGHLKLVVDNPVRTDGALRERRHKVARRDVLAVAVPHAAGGLAPVLRLLADAGVNVEYAYSGGGSPGTQATVVLGVDDPMRAAAAAGIG